MGEEPERPAVSVIVPFRNARSHLPTLVHALRRQTCPAFEVIWIDDGSTDGGGQWLQERLAEGWHLLVHRSARGSYAARNVGIRVAKGDKLAFTDVDGRPHDDWIEQGLAALALAPRVAGRIQMEVSPAPSTAELVDATRFLRQDRYVLEGFAATANLFVHRSVFDRVGDFDEHLRSGGDQEFGWRCSKAGIPIRYAANATVSHPARASLRQLLRKGHRVGYGMGQVIRRGGMPVSLLMRRARERLTLVLQNRRTTQRMGARDQRQSLQVSAVHLCVAVATSIGVLRGAVLGRTGASPEASDRSNQAFD